MASVWKVVAVVLLGLFTSCGSVSVVSNTLSLPAGSSVELAEVVFDYASFREQKPDWLEKMRGNEAVWRTALEQAYASRARDLGLNEGSGALSLRVRVTDLNPGSRAARFWVGAGRGLLIASVDAGEHGTMETKGTVKGSNTLENVFRELGIVIADEVAAARK